MFTLKRLELPERYESVTFSSEDVPDLQAKEDLDFGHGVGLFPELQMDDESVRYCLAKNNLSD